MIREVTIEDIQPGAEFYSVFCIGGWVDEEIRHLVCNTGPITWSESHTEKDCVRFSYMRANELKTSISSLIDLHIIRKGAQLECSYNLHRWFHTKEDAELYIESIQRGTMQNPMDQKFLDERIASNSVR
ncbi:hypothetical protein MYO4S_00268 [Serratia phage 4S]|nr:hypothetical protein MYO4S_00268 [Serratia phage 4S]